MDRQYFLSQQISRIILYIQIHATVSEMLAPNALVLSFNRQLAGIFNTEWCDLLHELSFFQFNYCEDDTLTWRWTVHDRFIVHSLYLWLEYGGIQNTEYTILWSLNIPLKIKKNYMAD
jgi:hypothetical protein